MTGAGRGAGRGGGKRDAGRAGGRPVAEAGSGGGRLLFARGASACVDSRSESLSTVDDSGGGGAATEDGPTAACTGDGIDADGGTGVCDGRERASRIAAALSTSAFDRESSRVNLSVSPGESSNARSLYATTRPSPRTSGAPVASASSKRSTTPCGLGCAPSSTMLVFVTVSSSRARNASSSSYGRVMRIATGVLASSATGGGYHCLPGVVRWSHRASRDTSRA